MINKVVLVGRLTRDPELRYTPNGVAVTRFTLAVNRRFTNQNGEREADFIPIVAWRGLAENVANYCHKGSLVGVQGEIRTGKYETQDGETRYTFDVAADDVRFLEPKKDKEAVGAAAGGGDVNISDDDLPF